MNKYRRGKTLEYVVKKLLESQGCYVVHSSRSLGVFDLVAFRGHHILFVQCKVNKTMTESAAMKLLIESQTYISECCTLPHILTLVIVEGKEDLKIYTSSGLVIMFSKRTFLREELYRLIENFDPPMEGNHL